MKFIFAILLFVFAMASGYCDTGTISDIEWVPDTCYFGDWRVTYNIPSKYKMQKRITVLGDEMILNITFRHDNILNIRESMRIEFSPNPRHDYIIKNDKIDKELWNTFNQDNKGSRSYVVNDRYTRIDELYKGFTILYKDLEYPTKEIADRIIRSINFKYIRKPPRFSQSYSIMK